MLMLIQRVKKKQKKTNSFLEFWELAARFLCLYIAL